MIFGKYLVCHCVTYESLFHSVSNERKMACFELCFSSEVMQNEGTWNFHGSLTLNKEKLI